MAATNSAINNNTGSFKSSARVATTANITLSGTQTIDGVSAIAGDRVLVKNQTTGSQNGIYVVSAGAWSRDIDNIVADVAFIIEEGTVNAEQMFILATNNPIVVGTTSLSFTQFAGTTSGTNTGDVTLAAFGASPNANAASLSGQQLTLQPASATQPGGVSTTTQTFAGAKTFANTSTWTGTGNQITLTGSTLANGGTENWLTLTGTMPTTPTAGITGINFNMTSAGSQSLFQQGMQVTLGVGFTGANSTYGLSASNNAAGSVAQNIAGFTGNFGFTGQSHPTSALSTNWGVGGEAQGGAISLGVGGIAKTAKNNATNIGVLGFGINTGTTPTQIGGYFGLHSADPTFTSAALICDNGSTTSPIFIARDNGTAVITVADGGATTFTQQISSSVASSSVAINLTSGAIIDFGGAGNNTEQLRRSGANLIRSDGEIQGTSGFVGDRHRSATAVTLSIRGDIADGASAVALKLHSNNTLSTAGAKIISIQNNATEKLSIDKDGFLTNPVDQAFTMTSSRADASGNIGFILNSTNAANANFKLLSIQGAGVEVAWVTENSGLFASSFKAASPANSAAQFNANTSQTIAARWGWFASSIVTDQASAHHCVIGESNAIAGNFDTQILFATGYSITTTGGGTYPFQVTARGRIDQSFTDNSGTPGNTTINTPTGRAAIAAAASAITVTCAACTSTASKVQLQLETADATLGYLVVVPAAGSFTVTNYSGAVATAVTGNVTFTFSVQNP